jgi:hypothetical protein
MQRSLVERIGLEAVLAHGLVAELFAVHLVADPIDRTTQDVVERRLCPKVLAETCTQVQEFGQVHVIILWGWRPKMAVEGL